VGTLVCMAAFFVAFLAGTLLVWEAEEKITMTRQLEVFSFRLAVALAAYVVVGVGLLFVVNVALPGESPLALGPGFASRALAWPFQALVQVGCSSPLPTPPGACAGFT
jgi:hypothetical protein